MTPLTILRFLFGCRAAIERIAACRQAPWIGLLLVFSAALAREYDGQDLLHEPWHLFLPLFASLATSFVLYLLLRVVGWFRAAGWKPFWSGYWSFLGLYWMTAPLAWLYAIPVERFLSEADATRANLWLLAIVSLWRVLLITRVASVLWSAAFGAVLWPVMLFADSVAIVLIVTTPRPILAVMGGVRLSEAELIVYGTSNIALVLGILSWPLWLLGTAAVIVFRPKPRYDYAATTDKVLMRGIVQPESEWNFRQLECGAPVSRSAWLAAAAILLAMLPLTCLSQQPQLLRRAVERDLRAGRVDNALRLMSAHDRRDFPPLWDPPPRIAYRGSKPRIIDIINRLNEVESAPWVREIYISKFSNYLRGEDDSMKIWHSLDARELDEHLAALEQLPERARVINEHVESLRWLLRDEELPQDVRGRVRNLLGDRADDPQATPTKAIGP